MISSQIIIVTMPNNIPSKHKFKLEFFNDSGIKSKHIMAVIKPEANCNTKLKNFLEVDLKIAPITPPNVVPIIPKIRP